MCVDELNGDERMDKGETRNPDWLFWHVWQASVLLDMSKVDAELCRERKAAFVMLANLEEPQLPTIRLV